ncbi:MAG: protein-glutamate O-methyltransferase CheR [Desulfobacula sp.]|jgi:chemotaxis protein methyltransferase CheR
MKDAPVALQSTPHISGTDFKRLAGYIHSTVGIKLPPQKKGLLESRLKKRLNKLGMDSYYEYTEYFFSPEGQQDELSHLIDAITTNKTDFFREPNHFTYLTETALPELMQKKAKILKHIDVWSSACSRGDEPYTLAMVLDDFLTKQGFDFSITATDISSKVLNIATKGVYDHETIEPVPLNFRKKYLLRSKDESKNMVRIIPDLREKIQFKRLNLMESFTFLKKFDVIFCRNVIIYFDAPTTRNLMQRICGQLKPGGFLFMGHSELLEYHALPVEPAASTVYQKNLK